MKSALPWLASLLALTLLFTPTYGIGLVLAPLTLIGSWIALAPITGASRAVRVGAAFNLLLVVAGLTLLTMIWAPVGLFALVVAWALFLTIVPLAYMHLRPAP